MGGRRCTAAAAALALALAAPSARGDDARLASVPAAPGWTYRAAAREDFRLRQATDPDASDQKSHLVLDLGAHHPADRLSITASIDAWWDVDGVPAPGAAAPALPTVWDRRNPWIDVVALAADWRPGGALRRARAGRQETTHGPPATFDGVSVLARPAGPDLDLFAFGGRGVRFFQVVAGTFEDWLASAGVTWRATHALRLEVDYRLVREDVALAGGSSAIAVDHGYGLVAHWRSAGDALRARVFARGLDARLAHAGGAAAVSLPGDLTLDVRAAVQPVTLRDVSELENPYFATLGESRPFARGSVELSRPFSSAAGTIAVHAGWQGRAVLEGGEGPFNRSFGRAWLLASGTRLGGTGLFASAAIERIGDDAALGGHGLWAVDGSAGWEGRGLRAELGSLFQRWRYTYYRDVEETVDVRSVYAEVRYSPTRRYSFRARAAREVSATVLQTFFVGAAQSFE